MAKALIAIALALLCVTFAHASPAKKQPNWNELNADQQQILAPLQNDWDQLEPVRKRKWLGIAKRYPKMKPEEQQRVQKRMQTWARLTPEQRRAARERH